MVVRAIVHEQVRLLPGTRTTIPMAKSNCIYIDRSKIPALLKEIGKKKWESFKVGQPVHKGTEYHYEVTANNKKATISFNFNRGGTTTLNAIGSNTKISKALINGFKGRFISPSNILGESHTFKNVSKAYADELIEHMGTLARKPPQKKKENKDPIHTSYTFIGNCGDKLYITICDNGTISVQGKPAYLYNEAISFLSLSQSVSHLQIIESTNTNHKAGISSDQLNQSVKRLFPKSYNILDESIVRLLSPSIYLRDVDIAMDDYSCYAFPALKALEAYIKLAFAKKGIKVKDFFSGIFDDGVVTPKVARQINDETFIIEIEKAYDFYRHIRHALFHASQDVDKTPVIKTREEADNIVDHVFLLIDNTCDALLT